MSPSERWLEAVLETNVNRDDERIAVSQSLLFENDCAGSDGSTSGGVGGVLSRDDATTAQTKEATLVMNTRTDERGY